MRKGDLSLGDDTPTGEPEPGPRGPYIMAEDDGTDATKPRRVARGSDRHPGGSRTETRIARKSVIGSDNAGDAAEPAPSRPDLPNPLKKGPKGPLQP